MKISKIFKSFIESEKSGGLLLIFATLASLVLANLIFGENYVALFEHKFVGYSIEFWINDGLMTLFFLLIGLELEREIYQGELSNFKDALFPFFGALGGMVAPALIFLIFNFATKSQSGLGIPMATDIAFSLGILSLLGNKITLSMKLFLTALAVIDDLGAIFIIAFFYTKAIIWSNLIISLSIFLFLLLLNKLKIKNLIIYLTLGVFMWYFMLISGVHATITGVLLAFTIPFANGDEKSSSFILQNLLHKPVAFIVLPLFALANTAIVLNEDLTFILKENYSLGILFGLTIGKPLGIMLFTFIATKLTITKLPEGLNWKSVFGISILAGIGFTMSIFIALLAFDNQEKIINAKKTILFASLISGIVGFIYLKFILKDNIIDK